MTYALTWLFGALTVSCFWGAWIWRENVDMLGWLIATGAILVIASIGAAFWYANEE